jgi:AraC-like DNA-binding protein
MKKDHLQQPFELVLRDPMDSCPRGEHAHSFFEMIYVVAGTGRQHVNEVSVLYHPGSLFLVAPGDVHLLEIETLSRILFIRFNPLFIHSSGNGQALRAQLEMILNNSRHEPGCLLKTESDKKYVPHLMNMLMDEHQKGYLYHRELINQLVNTLLIVVARNISPPLPTAMVETSELRIHDILRYIQTNIHTPHQLRADVISENFQISETYLGRYFKKHAGETLQQYIIDYRLKLVENRLLHSSMRIGEIADEFGFTDKSHLNRIFKKYRGTNPSDFKQGHALR